MFKGSLTSPLQKFLSGFERKCLHRRGEINPVRLYIRNFEVLSTYSELLYISYFLKQRPHHSPTKSPGLSRRQWSFHVNKTTRGRSPSLLGLFSTVLWQEILPHGTATSCRCFLSWGLPRPGLQPGKSVTHFPY